VQFPQDKDRQGDTPVSPLPVGDAGYSTDPPITRLPYWPASTGNCVYIVVVELEPFRTVRRRVVVDVVNNLFPVLVRHRFLHQVFFVHPQRRR